MSAPYSINIIAEFDSVFDVDFGIVRLIKEYFNVRDESNGKYVFDQTVINADNYFLRYLLYSMENNISDILIEAESERYIAEDICSKIKSDAGFYTKALNLSPPTTIHNLLKVYAKTDGVINVSVLCKNEEEKTFIKKSELPVRTILGSYESSISSYGVIIVNRFVDVLKYYTNTKFEGKEILIPSFRYNMDDKYPDKPILEVVALLGNTNKIKTVCPYHNFVLPVEE